MEYMILIVTFILQSVQCVWCFNISISGETYIEAGVPYMVTCSISYFENIRRTVYGVSISDNVPIYFIIAHSTITGCYYEDNGSNTLCPSSLCSCDTDGLATHWIYNTSTDLSSTVTFRCESKDNDGFLSTSEPWEATVSYGPGSSISFTPADESITKIEGQRLGPIVCSAKCIPPCQLHWIKRDGTVVDGSTLDIPSLTKNEHGTFTCHAGNGYGNNATQNLNLTINYGPESVTLSPSNTRYNVTEGDTIPSISCTASCRPRCTFTWTGPNVPDGTNNDLYLQNINRNQKGAFYCTAINEVGSKMSSNVEVDVQYGPGSNISFNPANESITKVLGQSLGPIYCSAQCNPPCQLHWIKPDGTVVDGSTLDIQNLTKNEHGTFTCHAGNGYGNNATQNIKLTVNYGPEYVSLSPPSTMYNVTEGDTIPSITCTASCRPPCTFTWTGSNVPGGTTNDLYLEKINRNQNGTFYCTAINEVGSKMSSNVEVDVRYGPDSSVSFNPANESITKVLEQSLGPIVCSAQCNPPCQLHWIKPDGTVVDGSNLKIQSLSKNDHGTFTCHTGNGYGNNATKNLSLIVNYGPESVILSPPNTTYTVTEDDTIPSISCNASCRPPCTFMWTGPNVPGGTTNDLYLQNINRNQTGTFNCTATNEVGSKMSSNIEVDVQYQAKVENVDVNTNNTVDENSTVKFSCLLEGNPAPTVTWSLNGKILQTTEGSTTKSSFIVNSARCNNTGRYICTASNIIGNSEKQEMLFVRCHPRSAIIPDTPIAIKDKNGALNITVPIISYPQPTSIRWTFRQNETPNITDVDSNYTTTTYGVYQHVLQLIKDNVTDSEYGEYSINVSNNIDPNFTHVFTVVAERRPDRPSNVSAVCDSSPFSTTISWKSKYNGGREQTFSIWFKINSEKEHVFELYRDNILDEGRNKYITMHITSLQASTAYTFYANSSNIYGFSKSNHVFCNTTAEKTHTESNTAVIGIVAGTSSAIVVVIVVVVIVIIRRRWASDADNGLKDNILYESAGSDFDRKPSSTRCEGAVVQNKGNKFHANDDDMIRETGLYAEVKKKPKLGQKGEINENIKSTGKAKGKDNMKEYKDEDVYENMEDKVGNGRPTSQSTDKRNKDGLQYADLMFNPSPNGARFIIHGQDDKTIYAEVDTRQKIDPLPDSDVEEDQNITNSNNTKD